MNIGEFVKSYREEHGLSMQAFGERCGLSRAYISILEKGINPTTGKPFVPAIDTLNKIATATNNTIDNLLHMLDGDQPIKLNAKPTPPLPPNAIPIERGTKIPILGRVVAGEPMLADENILGYVEVSKDIAKDNDVYGLYIVGDSMFPELKNGDIAVIKKAQIVESGKIAVVLVNGDEATIKIVEINKNGITLIGINPSVFPPRFYPPSEVENLPVQIIGKLVEVHRKY